MSELKSITATDEEKQRMMDILQRLHAQELAEAEGSGSDEKDEEDQEEEGGLSQQTMARLLARLQVEGKDAELTEADLTPEELQRFHRALADGQVGCLSGGLRCACTDVIDPGSGAR